MLKELRALILGVEQSTGPCRQRDPNSPVLAAAIAKRERRARKLTHNAYVSYRENPAHDSRNLNPLYVNREV